MPVIEQFTGIIKDDKETKEASQQYHILNIT